MYNYELSFNESCLNYTTLKEIMIYMYLNRNCKRNNKKINILNELT